MEKDQITGILLILAIFAVYFIFLAPEPEQIQSPDKPRVTQETVRKSALPANALVDTTVTLGQDYVLENADLKLTINSRGGQLKSALLKNYKTYYQKPLYIFSDVADAPAVQFALDGKAAVSVAGIQFAASGVSAGKQLSLTGRAKSGEQVMLNYRLADKGFLVDVTAMAKAASGATADSVVVNFSQRLRQYEKDFEQSRITSTINYLNTEEEFDNLSETESAPQGTAPVGKFYWVSHKQKFFNAGLIQKDGKWSSLRTSSHIDAADSTQLKTLTTHAAIAKADMKSGVADFSMYFGPNKYNILQTVGHDYERNVHLGWPILRWVNKYLVLNVFNFLERYISNYGIIIFLLVLAIRILLLPLGYKSYISMAKMRVLKPEIDEIKSRLGDDSVAIQQEQMKLYQQVGVSPLQGCIPLLLQMPILLAMFNFFPNSIELRQESLWWSEDLSTYDSVFDLPFKIPGYGDHVSLFTILMTLSTLAITYFNSQGSALTGQMATLQYIMPLVFTFVLNSLPAGLNYYYLVSNLVSLGQQFAIKSTVDDTKIRAKLETNKEKNAVKPPSKFAERLQTMLKASEEARKQQQQTQSTRRSPKK